jgi:hypothetical protein
VVDSAQRQHLLRAWALCKQLGLDYLLHPHLSALKAVDPDATRQAREKKLKATRAESDRLNKPRYCLPATAACSLQLACGLLRCEID